jgi:hypothetical protein
VSESALTTAAEKVTAPTVVPAAETPIEVVGREIAVRVAAGDEMKLQASELYKSANNRQDAADAQYRAAGALLIDARKKVKKNFDSFLEEHCGGLARSRAYELIRVAGGKVTFGEIRAETNARKKRHRAKKAQLSAPAVTSMPSVPPALERTESESVTAATAAPSGTERREDRRKWLVAESKQRERFDRTLFLIGEHCANTEDMIVPPLTAAEKEEACTSLVAARRVLDELLSRVRNAAERDGGGNAEE